jgi:hypothetical protein
VAGLSDLTEGRDNELMAQVVSGATIFPRDGSLGSARIPCDTLTLGAVFD